MFDVSESSSLVWKPPRVEESIAAKIQQRWYIHGNATVVTIAGTVGIRFLGVHSTSIDVQRNN